MLIKDNWTKEQLADLYKMRQEEKKDLKEISTILKKSIHAITNKFKRVDWDKFLDDPDVYLSGNSPSKKWTQVEMASLHAFLDSGKSYNYIAEKMGRSYVSIERKAQTTNWQAWKTAVGENPENVTKDKEELKERFVNALVLLSRYDHERLKNIDEKEFLRKINFEEQQIPISFSTIKDCASVQLDSLGFGNPEVIRYEEGAYIVVGDSHGKHTKTKMFEMLKQVEKLVKPKKIIHIGHLLDDDNDISYNWGLFKNLVIVSKIEELKTVQEQRNKYNFKYEVVRGGIQLGQDLLVMNQDIIGDYVKTPISSLDSQIFDDKVIVNCHRLELMPKCSNESISYFASPGALCERHIISTIKQIDFDDQKTVKQAFYGGFSKYRRMQHMFNYWDQGLIIVHVSKTGEHTIIPCTIRKIGKSYTTSYFDKMISSEGISNPDKKILVTADTHSPCHDTNVLDVQEQVNNDYKSDVYVNMGDAHDHRSLNHHVMERGITITLDVLDESASVYHVLKRQSAWAKERHLLYGNHERFALDFVSKFPQLTKCLDFDFLCNVDSLGYSLTDLKEVLKIGSTNFIHGDLTMYGQPGSKLEKTSRTFGDNTFVGHIHYPSIRFGSYSIGLAGKLDQDYNEPSASTWTHGFGMCNQYKGHSWLTTIAIINGKCCLNGKTYVSKSPKNWEVGKYKISLKYEEV